MLLIWLQLPAKVPVINLRFCIRSSSCIQTPRPGKQWAFAALSRADMSTNFFEALQKPKVVFSFPKSIIYIYIYIYTHTHKIKRWTINQIESIYLLSPPCGLVWNWQHNFLWTHTHERAPNSTRVKVHCVRIWDT